jgi:hypothetical protein
VMCKVSLIGMFTYRSSMSGVINLQDMYTSISNSLCARDIELCVA